MFPGRETLQRLRGVQLCGRAQDRGIDPGARKRFGEVRGGMRHAVFVGHFPRGVELPANHRHDLDTCDEFEGVEMLHAERTGARNDQLQGLGHAPGSRMRWPTAVFDAGT